MITIVVLALSASTTSAQSNGLFPVKAIVLGLRPDPGNVLYIGLMDESGEQRTGHRLPVVAERMEVDLSEVPAGRYAVRLFQDENDNGTVDTGMFKIPKEGVGCSNNAEGFMSAPAFKDMLFEVNGPKVVGIAVKYY